jgi:hypothetical protein
VFPVRYELNSFKDHSFLKSGTLSSGRSFVVSEERHATEQVDVAVTL